MNTSAPNTLSVAGFAIYADCKSSESVAGTLYGSPNGLHPRPGTTPPIVALPVLGWGVCGAVPPPEANTEGPGWVPNGLEVLAYWVKAEVGGVVVEGPGGGVPGGVGSRTLVTPKATCWTAVWNGVVVRDGSAVCAIGGFG